MSKREESSALRLSPRTSQRKTSSGKQRSLHEDSITNRKGGTNSVEETCPSKSMRTERSTSSEDPTIGDKYIEVVTHLNILYGEFQHFASTKVRTSSIIVYLTCVDRISRKKAAEVIRRDTDDPVEMIKSISQVVKALSKTSSLHDVSISKNREEELRNSYEELLQKAENDIRQHIRIEQQLKLLIDNMQAKIDDNEKVPETPPPDHSKTALKELKVDNSKLTERVRQKDQEIATLQKALKKKDEVIKSYEEQISSSTILEHKLTSLTDKYLTEKENIRDYYDQEYANLTKETKHIQRVLGLNLSAEDKSKLLQEELLSYQEFNLKKLQILENRLKQFNNNYNNDTGRLSTDRNDTELFMETDPGGDDRRMSARPSTTATSVLKSRARGYDLNSHSTEIYSRSSENRPSNSKQNLSKKKKEIIQELKTTPVLATRSLSKSNIKEEQPQQGPPKTQKDVESYFNYLKKRLEKSKINSLQHGGDKDREKDKEQIRSFDARRSSSVKRGAYLAPSAVIKKDKSSDKLLRGADMSRTQEEKSECHSSEHPPQRKSVPKLRAPNTIHSKAFKY